MKKLRLLIALAFVVTVVIGVITTTVSAYDALYSKTRTFSTSYNDSVSSPYAYESTLSVSVSGKTVTSTSSSAYSVYRNVFAYIRSSSGNVASDTKTGTAQYITASKTGGLFFGTPVYASHDALVNEQLGRSVYYIIIAN